MTDTKAAEELINRYHRGEASEQDIDILLYWIAELEQEGISLPADIEAIKKEMWQAISPRVYGAAKLKLWPRVAVVAAAVAALVFGIWIFNSGTSLEERAREIASENDVPPAANRITLTLASGKTIPLSNTKDGIVIGSSGLKYMDSSEVAEPWNNKNTILTINTDYSSTYHVIFPDGSKIWLNTASTLKFPSTPNKLNTRTVELRGEAYFEIAKLSVPAANGRKPERVPFVVNSGNQVITVLGTHFNVNTYDYIPEVRTTLLEGSVQVKLAQEPDQKKNLKPGEQASSSDRVLLVSKADTAAVMAWRRGDFVFVNDDLETILQRLKNWYNVDFEYKGKKPKLKMSGVMPRTAKLSKVLALIEAWGKVKFKIEGRKVYIENKN